jgi:hypothetical protein
MNALDQMFAFIIWAAQFCLAALSGQSPEARQGRASWREGLTAKARAKP